MGRKAGLREGRLEGRQKTDRQKGGIGDRQGRRLEGRPKLDRQTDRVARQTGWKEDRKWTNRHAIRMADSPTDKQAERLDRQVDTQSNRLAEMHVLERPARQSGRKTENELSNRHAGGQVIRQTHKKERFVGTATVCRLEDRKQIDRQEDKHSDKQKVWVSGRQWSQARRKTENRHRQSNGRGQGQAGWKEGNGKTDRGTGSRTERRVWDDLSYLGAMNREIRTANTCIISRYSVVRILKQICMFWCSAKYI